MTKTSHNKLFFSVYINNLLYFLFGTLIVYRMCYLAEININNDFRCVGGNFWEALRCQTVMVKSLAVRECQQCYRY